MRNNNLIFKNLPLSGAFIIETKEFMDNRGVFSRLLCKQELAIIGFKKEIVQVNLSINYKPGVIRGMHFQKMPRSEVKMIRCVRGSIFDVIVDLRESSSTIFQWHAEILTDKNKKMLYIPEGFAHGFQTLEPDCQVIYFVSDYYCPELEGAVRYDDPKINIQWPMEISEISKKDKQHPYLSDVFKGLKI